MGQLQNQFQQMMGGQSPYSGGGGQRRGNFGTPGYQQPQTRGTGGYSGMPQPRPQQPGEPWQQFEPQRPQQAPMQRGIDQMPGRAVQPTTGQGMQFQPPQLSGPPMMPPTKQPPVQAPPPGTGGIKPSREPLGPPDQAPVDAKPMAPMQAQTANAGQMTGGSVSQPLGQMQPPHRRGYPNPYKKQGGPQVQTFGGEMGPDLGPNYSY